MCIGFFATLSGATEKAGCASNRLHLCIETALDSGSDTTAWVAKRKWLDADAAAGRHFLGQRLHARGMHDIVVSWHCGGETGGGTPGGQTIVDQGGSSGSAAAGRDPRLWRTDTDHLWHAPSMLGTASRSTGQSLDSAAPASASSSTSAGSSGGGAYDLFWPLEARSVASPAPLAAYLDSVGATVQRATWVPLEQIAWTLDPAVMYPKVHC